jgi:hypothetical protein
VCRFDTQRIGKISLSSFYGFYNKDLQANFKSVPFRYKSKTLAGYILKILMCDENNLNKEPELRRKYEK